MPVASTTRLSDCIARFQSDIPGLADVAKQLQRLAPAGAASNDTGERDDLIALYDRCYPLLEKALWNGDTEFDLLLDCYQALFREQEVLLQQRPRDDRHDFILSIPVADRPSHLRACLESILQVCTRFTYGGRSSGRFDRITVIVAEDSRQEKSVQRHLELVEEYRQKGLEVVHFGLDEQYALLQALPPEAREQLGNVLTTQPKERFYLKGQAANRNLSYLKCLQLTGNRDRTLYYLVDSDQAFCVNRRTAAGEQAVYALNYFYYIDAIFRATNTLVLTGKLVGDPPVSPSVMAANFLDDVTAFFTHLAAARREQACSFHAWPLQPPDDAAYHDLAGLFGFENAQTAYPYRCRLDGEHDHAACVEGFAARLGSFFFGEHLTRGTLFRYGNAFTEIQPARTVYPGNYIVNYEGLKYIIPFGHLRLRMSGPTAGRLIAAEIGDCFASVNLPMLHGRTTDQGLDDDFRPGVELEKQGEQLRVDLSNEFERQFFGDLMLFSCEMLVKQADVKRPFELDRVNAVIDQKEQELLALYRQKQEAVLEKNRRLEELVFDAGHWWSGAPGLDRALAQVKAFIENIDHNFGPQSLAWRRIQSAEHRAGRKLQIAEALMHYRAERDAWDRLVR